MAKPRGSHTVVKQTQSRVREVCLVLIISSFIFGNLAVSRCFRHVILLALKVVCPPPDADLGYHLSLGLGDTTAI